MFWKKPPDASVFHRPTAVVGNRLNDPGVDGLRPSFGGGRPPKLSDEQFAELCEILEEGQPWTPRAIHALIKDRYGVTYDPAHLSRKLRASGMHYAKPRPMDPRSPEKAEEVLAERLAEALGEEDADVLEEDPLVLGFFMNRRHNPLITLSGCGRTTGRSP